MIRDLVEEGRQQFDRNPRWPDGTPMPLSAREEYAKAYAFFEARMPPIKRRTK